MDVAVVGAGPAGTWAAERLARGGARVTIFDASHPREKPCGGGVTGRALDLVTDAIDTSAIQAVAVEDVTFEHQSRRAHVALSDTMIPEVFEVENFDEVQQFLSGPRRGQSRIFGKPFHDGVEQLAKLADDRFVGGPGENDHVEPE